MIGLGRGILETGSDIFDLKIGIIPQNFVFRHTRGEQIEQIGNANAHTANAGPPAALVRIECDSTQIAHESSLSSLALLGERVHRSTRICSASDRLRGSKLEKDFVCGLDQQLVRQNAEAVDCGCLDAQDDRAKRDRAAAVTAREV